VSMLLDLASWAALVLGGALVLVGGLGIVRLPDSFTRLHAASLTDTLGAGLVLVGLALQIVLQRFSGGILRERRFQAASGDRS